jgi:hypothetical protein
MGLSLRNLYGAGGSISQFIDDKGRGGRPAFPTLPRLIKERPCEAPTAAGHDETLSEWETGSPSATLSSIVLAIHFLAQ